MELEDDLNGDVDFDFFDSPGKGHLSKSPSPKPVEIKQSPPLAPVFLSRESTKQGSERKDVCVDMAATSDTNTSLPLPDRQAVLHSVCESDPAQDYSDSFSDISSVGSKKRSLSPSSSRSCSSSGSRSRSLSQESVSSRSSNSSDSSVSRECSPSRSRSKRKGKQLSGNSKSTVSFSDGDGFRGRPEIKVSQRPNTAHHKSRKQMQNDKNQAWESKPTKSEHPDDKLTKDKKNPLYSDQSDASSRSGPFSQSDSDMTDVSPLTSPKNSPKKKLNVQYRQMPLDDREEYEERGMHTNEDIDLSILMKALCDHENEKQEIANRRRVMFAPSKNTDRHNYTYTNDRATVIDRENQRLLNQIMRTVNPKQQERYSKSNIRTNLFSPPRRLTSSAVNRKREQRRIEMDNMAMLQRLHKIRPSKGMSRGDQIKEFEKVTLYGVPVAAVEKRRHVPQVCPSASGLSQRSRSMTSVHSASTIASRRSTASSTRLKTLVDPRPQWCDKW